MYLVGQGRHVSFASPPVDHTISALSYPSSPESARSPPQQFPDSYRAALASSTFAGLGFEVKQDSADREALQNTQNNATIGQEPVATKKDAVRTTLSRFAGPKAHPSQPREQVRQSMDVDAFARLLLTGDKNP